MVTSPWPARAGHGDHRRALGHPGILPEVTDSDFQGDQEPPLCAAARASLGGLACVQIRMFGARSSADWVVKHLAVDRDLVSELRFSGLDPS